jgi:GT2 family glycosyltransferase
MYRLSRNRGFSAGVNVGARLSRGRWLLVLNPDLVVCPNFIDRICTTATTADEESEEERQIGVIGFQLRNRDGTQQLSTGLFPTLGRMLLGLLRPRPRRKYQRLNPQKRQEVHWVTGSCLLARRACLRQLGGFDEEFFLYYEDVDFCRRAREKGWSVCYEPAVQAVHLDPLQNRPLTRPMWAITRHASLTYFRKHRPGWQFWALAQLVRTEAWCRQRWARWRNRADDAALCRQVRGICRDLLRRRPTAARARLEAVLLSAGMSSTSRVKVPCGPHNTQLRSVANQAVER